MSYKDKWWIGISTFFSIIAIILSIISLCNSNERDLQVDYIGIIGSLLAATVTVLIGWQIYSVIKLEDIVRKHSKIELRFLSLEKSLTRNSRILDAKSAMLHGANYITWVNNGADISALGTAYILLSRALKNFAAEFEKDESRKCLELMRDCLYITHDNDAWGSVFNDEVSKTINEDNKTLLNFHFSFYPEDAILYIRLRDSQENKRLCAELEKERIKNSSEIDKHEDITNNPASKTNSLTRKRTNKETKHKKKK